MQIRKIAIYLPQFHPIADNDLWWGKGFTEWTNVSKAKPLFKGHYQPHLPADLGFTDLRNADTRQAQADLAIQYGIDGFCYYHYWFNGKRLIERPFNEVLASGKPDFPFCLFWANETWSRRWLGEEKEILIKQTYSIEDDQQHALYLAKVFEDARCIKVNGRPLFIIYRPNDLPDVKRTINTIKETAYQRNKIEPYIVASNSHLSAGILSSDLGFDEVLNFRPQLGALFQPLSDKFSIRRMVKNIMTKNVFSGKMKIYSYVDALRAMERLEPEAFDKMIPSTFVGWDNSARRGKRGIIMTDNTPELFEQELRRLKKKILLSKNNSGLLFINAWNEWAEGNHLEPDLRNGTKYLQVVKDVFAT